MYNRIILYNQLWKTLSHKNMKKIALVKSVGISNGTLAELGKNESVSLSIIYKVYIALDCYISDIVEIKNNLICNVLIYNLTFYNKIEYLFNNCHIIKHLYR